MQALAATADRHRTRAEWPQPIPQQYPVVVKPRPGGSLTRDRPVELLRLGTDDTRLVQDMLPGDEYSIDVFADMAGTVVAAVPGSRCSSPRWSADVEPRDAHPERHAGRHDDVTGPGH